MNDTVNSPSTPARNLDGIPPAGSPPRRQREPMGSQRGGGAQMTVGPGITLKGDVTNCDTLLVEGDVDGTMVGEGLEIAEGGSFTGTATISEAGIYGKFDGELAVSGLLRIGGEGQVQGNVKYGRIEVEAGGRISGNIALQETAPQSGPTTIPAPHPGPRTTAG